MFNMCHPWLAKLTFHGLSIKDDDGSFCVAQLHHMFLAAKYRKPIWHANSINNFLLSSYSLPPSFLLTWTQEWGAFDTGKNYTSIKIMRPTYKKNIKPRYFPRPIFSILVMLDILSYMSITKIFYPNQTRQNMMRISQKVISLLQKAIILVYKYKIKEDPKICSWPSHTPYRS